VRPGVAITNRAGLGDDCFRAAVTIEVAIVVDDARLVGGALHAGAVVRLPRAAFAAEPAALKIAVWSGAGTETAAMSNASISAT
jgi:hypothetical protein